MPVPLFGPLDHASRAPRTVAAIQRIASRTNLALVWQECLPRACHGSHGRTRLRRWWRQECHQASGCRTQESAPDIREGGSISRRPTSPLPPESHAAPNQHRELGAPTRPTTPLRRWSHQAQAGLRAGGRANKWVSRSTPTISEYAAAVSSSAARPALSITVGTVSRSRSAAVRRPKSHIAGLAISATIAVAIRTGAAASEPLMPLSSRYPTLVPSPILAA